MSKKVSLHEVSWYGQFGEDLDVNLLNERAKLYRRSEQKKSLNSTPVVEFSLGGETIFGIDFNYVSEIFKVNAITNVPCTPNYIAGVVNRRSQLLAVYDINELFGIEKIENNSSSSWLIRLDKNCDQYGACLLVEDVLGNKTYTTSQLTKADSIAAVEMQRYIKGLLDKRVLMLDMDAFMNDNNLLVGDRSDRTGAEK